MCLSRQGDTRPDAAIPMAASAASAHAIRSILAGRVQIRTEIFCILFLPAGFSTGPMVHLECPQCGTTCLPDTEMETLAARAHTVPGAAVWAECPGCWRIFTSVCRVCDGIGPEHVIVDGVCGCCFTKPEAARGHRNAERER